MKAPTVVPGTMTSAAVNDAAAAPVTSGTVSLPVGAESEQPPTNIKGSALASVTRGKLEIRFGASVAGH